MGLFVTLLLFGLVAALLRAVATDLATRTISNRLTGAIALAAPLYWVATGVAPWPGMALQVALGAGVFGLFALVFATGAMGGGDVKLLGALALWLPPASSGPLLVLTALIGGALTLVMVAAGRWRGRREQIEVPYGLAIAGAALWILGEPYVYQFPG
jgi:prepilin peptidase CpaA